MARGEWRGRERTNGREDYNIHEGRLGFLLVFFLGFIALLTDSINPAVLLTDSNNPVYVRSILGIRTCSHIYTTTDMRQDPTNKMHKRADRLVAS